MAYNHGLEEKKFKEEWDRQCAVFIAAGMSDAAIEEMYTRDREAFNSDRAFLEQNISLESLFTYDGTACPEISTWGRYDWIDDLDTPERAKQIKLLNWADQELLTNLVVDGLSQAEIARRRGVSRVAISKKVRRIKNFLNQG